MWRLLAASFAAALAASACGMLPGSQPAATPTTLAATPAPAAQASPSVAATPTGTVAAAPKPAAATATPAAAANANKVYVGNTDGEGVYLRNTPAMDDKAQAYPDGTELTIIGEDVEGDGQHWHHVRAPDGAQGFVPSTYTTDTPP